MEIHVEGHKGPSKLSEKLDDFRDPDTGHVTMRPDEASKILLESLHVALKTNIPAEVEALFRLAEIVSEASFDYTEILEGVREESAEAREKTEKARKEMDEANIATPRKPSQPEI